MLSIGVLGFIVWSLKLASLLINNKIYYIINNFTIRWNDRVLYNMYYYITYMFYWLADYFFCLNNLLYIKLRYNRFTAPELIRGCKLPDPFQGIGRFTKYFMRSLLLFTNLAMKNEENKNRIISETLSENNFNFYLFRISYYTFFRKEFIYDDEWLTWFIGFTEGDGAILSYGSNLTFILTQKDPKILHEIRKAFGFGFVKNYGGICKYIVNNNIYCFLLYLIFNGNLVIKSKIIQLNNWYISLSKLKNLNLIIKFGILSVPSISVIIKELSLSNSWISGFTDAKGCFSAYKYQGKNKWEYCRCRFILDQKDEKDLLLQIKDLFCLGKVHLRNKFKSVYRLEINMNKPLINNLNLFLNYFENYPLKSRKRHDFQLWYNILDIIMHKKHKTVEGFETIVKLKNEMNKKRGPDDTGFIM